MTHKKWVGRERVLEQLRSLGRDLCLVGGISAQRTIPFGTPLGNAVALTDAVVRQTG